MSAKLEDYLRAVPPLELIQARLAELEQERQALIRLARTSRAAAKIQQAKTNGASLRRKGGAC